MDNWETTDGGTVEVTATGLYIDGEFLEDATSNNEGMTQGTAGE